MDSSLRGAGDNSPLTAFYRDGARDDRGRTLAEILAWDDERLEAIHDFIQWLFPLPERSGANPSAPVLDRETTEAFQTTPAMRERLEQAFQRMLRFYGLRWNGTAVDRGENFRERAQNWLWPGNHNHLRLTRILRSTVLLGLEAESKALFHALDAIYREFPDRISSRTHAFWSDAAQNR
ncbi:MAG: opioid growth factor receptor-related protein [Acidobacteriaceae bacterium]